MSTRCSIFYKDEAAFHVYSDCLVSGKIFLYIGEEEMELSDIEVVKLKQKLQKYIDENNIEEIVEGDKS